MDTKKKEKKYVWGIIGGLILGILFCALTATTYIYADYIAILGVTLFLGLFEFLGYKLLRGKIDKKLPWIIVILSIINVTIMSFIFIPTVLLIKSGITFNIKEIGSLYGNSNIFLNILQDFLLLLVVSVFGSYIVGNIIKEKIMLNVENIRLFSSDNKEKQEYKEKAIEAVKDTFKKMNALKKESAVKKADVIEQIKSENAKNYIDYLCRLKIIKSYKGKYYYSEESESNIKGHRTYWKDAVALAITVVLVAGILLSFGLISQAKKKFSDNKVSFSIDNTWNEYKTGETSNNTTEEGEATSTEKTWRFYKYMNASDTSNGDEEHSYPEIISVSYGENGFGDNMKINDLRNLLEGYFYEYLKFSNYQIEVSTTDNGYDTLEIMLGYEDSMEFCYYVLNGDKIAFISADTYSDDETLYENLETYTKEVVNSFKWNK